MRVCVERGGSRSENQFEIIICVRLFIYMMFYHHSLICQNCSLIPLPSSHAVRPFCVSYAFKAVVEHNCNISLKDFPFVEGNP